MTNINVTEQHNRVIAQEDGTVRVLSVGTQGPPGPAGPPGDPGSLPEPGDDGDVLTLADGSPIWATPEGSGGGLDPDGPETITGDWLFDRENLGAGDDESNNLRIGRNTTGIGSSGVSVGIGTEVRADGVSFGNEARVLGWRGAALGAEAACSSNAVAVGSDSGANRDSVAIGTNAFCQASSIAIGRAAGMGNVGTTAILIGRNAGRDNSRSNRLIIDNVDSNAGNLVDPLIDGRFRGGTDDDDFEYSKGIKVNGHLETTDQLILRSPDGTRWAVTVDDSGNLSTSLATEEITP